MIEYHFGSFSINGRLYNHDIKVIDGQVKYWKNHHLDLKDVHDAIMAKPEIIVIGTGASGAIEVSQEIKDYVEQNKIQLIILTTQEAVKKFNALEKRKRKVAAILHSTC